MGSVSQRESRFNEVDQAEFRGTMGRFATGVTLVTTLHGGIPQAMTANAFTSVSIHPPLILVCIDKNAHTHRLVERVGAFGVNILSCDQRELAGRFAGRHREMVDPFFDVPFELGVLDVPIIQGALASLDCSLYSQYSGGDHSIFVGEVHSVQVGGNAEPLAFYRGRFRKLAPEV